MFHRTIPFFLSFHFTLPGKNRRRILTDWSSVRCMAVLIKSYPSLLPLLLFLHPTHTCVLMQTKYVTGASWGRLGSPGGRFGSDFSLLYVFCVQYFFWPDITNTLFRMKIGCKSVLQNWVYAFPMAIFLPFTQGRRLGFKLLGRECNEILY